MTDDRSPAAERAGRVYLVLTVLSELLVLAAVVIGVLWITRKSLDHYLGISVFG